MDIDIAVEGDGIAFADELAGRLKGHVRPHEKFGTAVVVVDGDRRSRQRVDVASTRSESYAYPAALPKVEHAGIRSDLARRDFTINAMAVSLKPETFGNLLDYFGGLADLEARRIVVLHNLSFIEDPTRILRAIRYETRYGLRMDEHTLNLARACCAMDLVGDLSSARLRDELVALLDEEKIDFSLRRMEELGLTPSIHARLRAGAASVSSCAAATTLRRRTASKAEVPRWRLRLVWLLRDLDPEEIAVWAERMRIRRQDAAVLERGLLVARRLVERVRARPERGGAVRLRRRRAARGAARGDGSGRQRRGRGRLGRFLDVVAARAPRDRRRRPARHRLHRLAAHRRRAAQRAAPQAERRRRRPRRRARRRGADAVTRDDALLLRFLVTLPLLLVSLVLHELAHGWVAARLGDPTPRLYGRLTLNPLRHLDPWGTAMLVLTFIGSGGSFFFGWAKPVPISPWQFKHPQRGMMWVGLAGPAANALLAVAGRPAWSGYLLLATLLAAPGLRAHVPAQRDPRDVQPHPDPAARRLARRRRSAAARAYRAGSRSTATATTRSCSCSW